MATPPTFTFGYRGGIVSGSDYPPSEVYGLSHVSPSAAGHALLASGLLMCVVCVGGCVISLHMSLIAHVDTVRRSTMMWT